MSTIHPYHHFLGNGIDAVLLGPDGGMSPEAAQGLDRCYWYKSDLYYPDDRVLLPGGDPRTFQAAPPGGTNYQLAPLARAWFEIRDNEGEPLPLLDSKQAFFPEVGMLITDARYRDREVQVVTWLDARAPMLNFDLFSDDDPTVMAFVAPGLWPADTEQSDPVADLLPYLPGWRYRVGDCTCQLIMAADPETTTHAIGGNHQDAWLAMSGARVRWAVALTTSRYPDEDRRLVAGARAPAGRPLGKSTIRRRRADHVEAAGGPLATPRQVEIPDQQYQGLHHFSIYMFRAIQNRESGGLPVNNLRRTFNSHVFWDGAFVQRALLEAGHLAPAREAWRFLARTRDAAAANARATFDAPGLHWDWETTHRGERAYIPWMQQRFQVHNTPLLAHMIAAEYRASRDLTALDEGFDLLVGAATFILQAVLVEHGPRLATRPLVGSHESDVPVVDDGATVAACLRLLLDTALASRLLGRDRPFGRRCAAAAHRLRPTLAALFNGRYMQASRDEDRLNTSSLAPIYPADVLPPTDSRARATAIAYRARYAGRMAGHGNNELGFPWSAGVLARILAYQGAYHEAWEQLDLARVALCPQGGSAEYVGPDGRWSSQYFSTAQAALCSALHALLLQTHGRELRLFPAARALGWREASFNGFLAAGLSLDASYKDRIAQMRIENTTNRPRMAVLRLGDTRRTISLQPAEAVNVSLEDRNE